MNEFNLDKFIDFFKEGNHPQRALLLSGQEKFGGPFKKWNNSFTFNVPNGTYEIFQHDFHYEEFDFEHHDTMFSVKKKL